MSRYFSQIPVLFDSQDPKVSRLARSNIRFDTNGIAGDDDFAVRSVARGTDSSTQISLHFERLEGRKFQTIYLTELAVQNAIEANAHKESEQADAGTNPLEFYLDISNE